MLQKWKLIINNWINCYFSENNQDDRTVNIESLLNIISHLHENLNLDESKSSILEAHTVEGFLLEKYPEFKFENGTVESANEDDAYLVASLLLFFVCVNSKDVDIKSAMCSKLSGDDQEIILKFTKSLLECSPITLRDLQAAITDACGPDMASGHMKVVETPPALRSLHGEVRRLQAALDAERFDRNYLQEELARTNLRVEKLMNDKEQYKLDIVNLKAKISLCCREDQDQRGTEAEAEASEKLQRQLQDMEERLVRTQESLDDVTYERDTYKAKQESERAIQFGEELEVERKHMQALKELVNELRQHNRRNGLDTSLLECDDPDTSIQSLQQNLSVCSEACANVVEVQLGEERAKVDALKQQLQRLQEDMHELNQKADREKENFEKLLSERENEILNLKSRFNETVEKKDKEITEYYNEVVKLNNDNNELERRIKHNNEHSRQIIEQKMQEIQTLQEQKLSLLQSLSDETTKLENVIAELRSELEAEKQARAKMRDSYDNQMMKLNEKILNRNNELVELQNNVFEKSEMMETLQMNVRHLSEQKREVENKLHNKTEEMNAMQHSLEQNIASILKENEHFKLLVASFQEQCEVLEESKSQLEGEIKRFGELLKDTENLKNAFSEATEKLNCELDEKNAIINTLQTHLQDEIRHKIGYQEELQRLQTAKMYMAEDLNKLNVEYSKLKIELTGKDRTVESLEMSLKEARDAADKLKTDNEKFDRDLTEMSNEIAHKNKTIEILNNTLETTKKSLEDELMEKIEIIDDNNHKIANLTSNKQALQNKIDSINAEKTKLENELVAKSKQISQLQAECEKLTKTIDENKKAIRSLDQNTTKEKQKYAALEKTYDTETSKLMAKLNETEKTIKELTSTSRKTIKNKEHQIQMLTSELENTKKAMEAKTESIHMVDKEKEALVQKLEEEITYKNKIEKEYQNQCTQIESVTTQLNEELTSKNNEILALKSELDKAMKTIEEKCKEIQVLGERLSKEDQLIRDLAHQKTVETKDLQKKLSNLQSVNNELKQEVKQANECKEQVIAALQKENEQLQFAIEEDNSSHEVILKEKDCIIDRLEKQLKVHTDQLESLRKDYENITLAWETYKVETKENMQAKEEQIRTLTKEASQLKENISKMKIERDELVKKLEDHVEEMKVIKIKHDERLKELSNDEMKLSAILEDKQVLQDQLIEEKAAKDRLETENKQKNEEIKVLIADKNELLNEKEVLTQQLVEERAVKLVYEEERNSLVSEKTSLERKLLSQVATTENLMESKECLTQQLVEEKSAKELAEKEKENILLEKRLIEQKIMEVENDKEEIRKEINDLIEKHRLLDQQCMKEMEANEALSGEKLKLLLNLTEEQASKDVLIKENEFLVSQVQCLRCDLLEQKTIQDVLIGEKEVLLAEKDGLVKSLGVEKSAHDEIETEKDQLITKLCELNESYISKASSAQIELENLTQRVNTLEMDLKQQEEMNNQITKTLTAGLDKVIEGLKTEGIANEFVGKMTQSDDKINQATDECDMLINIANKLTTEFVMRQNLVKALEHGNSSLAELREVLKLKENQLLEMQTEIKRLQQIVNENKIELSKRTETYNTTVENKTREIQALMNENQALTNDLNDVKLQLEVKVHSLKEKLIDNENLTDKLKMTYECQIDNLNVMITKLSNYLKDKTSEYDAVRREKERLVQTIEENGQAIKALEEEIKLEVLNKQKLMQDFDAERQILKNMVTVTESIMEDQKVTLNNIIAEHVRTNEALKEEKETITNTLEKEKEEFEAKLKEKDNALEMLLKEMAEVKTEKDSIEKQLKEVIEKEIKDLQVKVEEKESAFESLVKTVGVLISADGASLNKESFEAEVRKMKDNLQNIATLEKRNETLKDEANMAEQKLQAQIVELQNSLQTQMATNKDLELTLKEKDDNVKEYNEKLDLLNEQINILKQDKITLEEEKKSLIDNNKDLETNIQLYQQHEVENAKLNNEKQDLIKTIEDNKTVVSYLEALVKELRQKNEQLSDDIQNGKQDLVSKCDILQQYHDKAEVHLQEREKEINILQKEITTLKAKVQQCEEDSKAKDAILSKISKEKDSVIASVTKELDELKAAKETFDQEIQEKTKIINELKQNLEEINNQREALHILKKENEELIKAVGMRETFAAAQTQEKTSSHKHSGHAERELRDFQQQVDNTSSDITHSSVESLKTITDLEKIINDKNRMITTLQSDVTYLKSLMAESETKLLDVTKDLELSKENCHQLSTQLKKIVHQKNEEIADLRKQVNKMSVTENRATQIIKVSAKYQAIILKRIAEIKTNTVLKELTNFGNSNNYDSEVKRSLSAGTVTMEDLENFLETTDRHLRKCSEKQLALQKERDRLTEVNKINESEILNMKKFLTELSVSFQTLSSIKEVYATKLSRVISMQRTVRREILALEGRVAEATLARLERGHGAAAQDLAEAALALQRWLERCMARTVSAEKLKQAFLSDSERTSLASASFQNAGLEVQLDELEKLFQQLLEDVARAPRAEPPRDAQAGTVMEVRAEYEDKLNRMKSKMVSILPVLLLILLYQVIAVFKEKQRGEVSALEAELARARARLGATSRAYEQHVRALTAELWAVGEKFLAQRDHAAAARRAARSASLMSLQHVHSVQDRDRTLHMSDEEGEVFDNRWLKELAATPRRESYAPGIRDPAAPGPQDAAPPGQRLSELRWRNSLCPPHLKSSYPAETQFAQAVDEEDIKCLAAGAAGGKLQRKEVGITAYKKPGPPTPSKQAGRLSATDSELRESLRVEAEPQPSRKTSTPSRIRSLFRSSRNDTEVSTYLTL
ncbi:hypothetical protein HF086_002389 [Spodoptera exigua]|uniref:Uncharacterized protein n=1 Tax=Spodoptera exigua TaxID=7107 RepID=A0A922MG52_SPOEX|nr:hypothetical protein HF086_002389 [Spodoptera exigua]